MSLQMFETLTCKPTRFGMHEYELKRRTPHATVRVSGIIAHNGKAATDIAHAVIEGRCNMIKAERVPA